MEQTRFEDAPIMSIHRRITAGTFMGQLSDGYTLGIVGIALSYAQGPLGLTSFWMGILAAASYAGILFGCLFAGMICDRIGRRPLYSSVMFFLIAFAVSQFFISDPILLATVRFFLGLLVGTDYTAGVALLSEWAPEKKRPTILAWLLLFWALGYCIAYLVGFVMDGLGENGWRWVICTSAVPAAITQIIRFGLPESPQWLVAVGKQDRAQEIISRFMGERYLVPQEQEKVESASWFSLFSARQWRKTVVSCAVWCCQTLPFFAISIFIPLVLEKLHVDNPHASGALYNVFTIAGVFYWYMGLCQCEPARLSDVDLLCPGGIARSSHSVEGYASHDGHCRDFRLCPGSGHVHCRRIFLSPGTLSYGTARFRCGADHSLEPYRCQPGDIPAPRHQ